MHLVQDVRKEFQSPKLPVVIGEITGPWREAPGAWNDLRKAQAAAAKRLQTDGPLHLSQRTTSCAALKNRLIQRMAIMSLAMLKLTFSSAMHLAKRCAVWFLSRPERCSFLAVSS